MDICTDIAIAVVLAVHIAFSSAPAWDCFMPQCMTCAVLHGAPKLMYIYLSIYIYIERTHTHTHTHTRTNLYVPVCSYS